MNRNKKYWQGIEQLENDEKFVSNSQKEFSEELPVTEFLGKKELDSTSTSRRDFLKFMGFGITAATLAACETPVIHSMPYVVKPEEVMPGIANYYASSYFDGLDYASIVVKTREGRPILIEGNKKSPVTQGGINARINSSLLSLYDTKRFKQPEVSGQITDWQTIDGEIMGKLQAAGSIRLLTPTIMSPSTAKAIESFAGGAGSGAASSGADTTGTTSQTPAGARDFKHVMFDPISASGILKANQQTFGNAVVPSYRFDNARTIVSIGADFLSNWLMATQYVVQYAKRRRPEGEWMSRHYQFETTMSQTGANADVRGAVRASDHITVAKMLYSAIGGSGGSSALANDDNGVEAKIQQAAADLMKNKGNSLVVAGSNDPNVQLIVNAINQKLGNYGNTIDISKPVNIRKGSEEALASLVAEMNNGQVDVLLIADCDPVFEAPGAMNFAAAMANVPTKIAMVCKPDLTTPHCDYVCPDNHYLESWNDYNPTGSEYSLAQPTIRPIYNTRQWQETLLKWSGNDQSYYQFVKGNWETGDTVLNSKNVFGSFWNTSLHDGFASGNAVAGATETAAPTFNEGAIGQAMSSANSGGEGWDVVFYSSTMGKGQQANNPWLLELPDPITKVVWDQYICMNPADMRNMGFNTKMGEQEESGVARVTLGEKSIELPVVPVPGQKIGTIGIALGYGKGFEGERQIGTNTFEFLPLVDGTIRYEAFGANVENTGNSYSVACTQTHGTMMGRKIINETDLNTFKNQGQEVWNPTVAIANAYGDETHVSKLDLWAEHSIESGHRWGMSIDLSACIGCGACVTACHAENNVPIVGKDEVNRSRNMHWLRIDRYFSSDADPELHPKGLQDKDYDAMEDPSAYPEVAFQPMLCQHCNHAPCETVCPVAATTHSDEGLNQMVYNRCIGTRYCANNCPYKVRRFNWFNYVRDEKFTGINPAQDELARMVLNPDVVVRSRGVMEKCTFCVQRIQEGKLNAKKKGEPIQDGSIQTACSSACSTGAIVFGDINDRNSFVHQNAMQSRAYHLLEEVGTQPNIWYQTKVRNVETQQETV